LLPNGKVLVAGGVASGGVRLASAELYDPASGTWTATGSLATPRNLSTATLLLNGKVLVAGGQGIGFTALASAELYDPASGSWTATGSLANARFDHTATLLPNGQVLVAAGDNDPGYLASAELYVRDGGAGLTLSAAKRKVGGINTVRLTWSGATSTNIDVYRNSALIVTTANDGSYTDSTGDTGRARYIYRVCEAGTNSCSNSARVTFGP
jgi:hypothetical protein